MYPANSAGLNRETNEGVYFFTPAFHPLDNFSAHVVELWGRQFPTAEHAYHWKKFSMTLPAVAAAVLAAKSAQAASEIAGAHKAELSASWHEEKVAAMEAVLRAKADQHADVRDALRRTGQRTIYENNPVDSFWGNGPTGDGQNMVGKIWMKIRSSLG